MLIIIAAIGTCGDIYPMLSIGRSLQDRGHEVIFISTQDFAATVKSHQLQFEPILDPDFYLKMMEFDGGGRVIKQTQRYLVEDAIPALYAKVKQHIKPKQTLLLGSIAAMYALRTVADAFSLPSMLIHYTPIGFVPVKEPPRYDAIDGLNKLPLRLRPPLTEMMMWFLMGPTVIKSLNRWRRQFGLKPIPASTYLYRWINSGEGSAVPVHCIALFPQWFARYLYDWHTERTIVDLPKNLTFAGFPLADNCPSDYQLPAQVNDFLRVNPKPIIFTFGTRVNTVKPLFLMALQACNTLQQPAIFLCRYPECLPDNLPPHILALGHLPLSKIVPQASVVVHHGGIGTATQALVAGVPQLFRPTMGDQFDNAARFINAGVALELLPKHFTAAKLAKCLQTLQQPQYRQRCQQVAQETQNNSGAVAIARACAAIEKFMAANLATTDSRQSAHVAV